MKEIKDVNLSLEYPLVYTEQDSVQKRINTQIADKVYYLKDKYDSGRFYKAKMSYRVTYEDDKVISIVLKNVVTDSRFLGGNHATYSWDEGLVFNKESGEQIPRSFYIPIKSAMQLQRNLEGYILKEYDYSGKQVYYYNRSFPVKTISDNYYLGGNGFIYLIYGAGSIGPMCCAPYTIEFSPEAANYFERMASRV